MYEQLIKRLREAPSAWRDAELHYKAADAIEDLENKLNLWRQDKISRWIPVTERLPRMYQQCWAACKMEGRENWVIEVQNYGIPYKKNPWGDCALLESGEMQVYAWMPIDQPEPPKEGEE